MPFAGDGLRYEIKEFSIAVLAPKPMNRVTLTREEIIAMAKVQELYLNGVNLFKLI